MFGIFKKKSRIEILQRRYEKLLKEYHQLSTSSRLESDRKYVEAQEVLKEMDFLPKN